MSGDPIAQKARRHGDNAFAIRDSFEPHRFEQGAGYGLPDFLLEPADDPPPLALADQNGALHPIASSCFRHPAPPSAKRASIRFRLKPPRYRKARKNKGLEIFSSFWP